MNRRDEVVREKIFGYCREIEDAHRHFQEDKALFCDQRNGAVYRNAVFMPLLQIGELAKNLSDEFRADYGEIPLTMAKYHGKTPCECAICSRTTTERLTMNRRGIRRIPALRN